jgi:hypothetical protein
MEFKVGDTVRVKTWDEMAQEFPDLVSKFGIEIPFLYTKGMADKYGGEECIIEDVYLRDGGGANVTTRQKIYLSDLEGQPTFFSWNELMIEPAVVDYKELKKKFKPELEFQVELL